MDFPYEHLAVVEVDDGGDPRAIGAAVTVALCGHWEHDGPCRWPHLTEVDDAEVPLKVRVAYTCSESERPQVTALIEAAIATGILTGPDAQVTRWRVVDR